ncbi:type-F conjugative transfer system pilin assembly protein TraF [Thiotrichales bacterium 19S9-12]|nr:type-F conjugative transfer system pilin assembly protein TraF [Thiotrichales bacterium 19S9-11]MCF6812524.1 type-F conjugative transfer system pilin assembly protein TraF [Thiotrichales bacterium 19S9-12]
MRLTINLLFLIICFQPAILLANFNYDQPQGFHWYRLDQEVKPNNFEEESPKPSVIETVSKSPVTPYQKLQDLSMQTKNILATALLEPTKEHTANYMKAQQYWAKQNQAFVKTWQEALLEHPELDYKLNFPTDNNAIPVRNDEQKVLVERVVSEMSDHYGLILFYQGNSAICQKFIGEVLLPLVKGYRFSMVSVTVDDKPIIGLPNPKSIPIEKANLKVPLKAKYLPALFLVNLKTKEMKTLSYGYISTNDLKLRFLDVANQFKRFSYEGLGETQL